MPDLCPECRSATHKLGCSRRNTELSELNLSPVHLPGAGEMRFYDSAAKEPDYVALYTRSIVRRGSRAHSELLAAGWTEELPQVVTSIRKG